MHLVLRRPFAAAWLLAVSLTARPASGQWVVYGQYPSEDMQKYYQVNAKCMSALNGTLSCPSTLIAEATDADYFNWEATNLTAMCTTSCRTSLVTWVNKVKSDCAGQQVNEDGHLVRPESIPLLYQTGYDLACLKSSSNDWCYLESYEWQGYDFHRYDPDACSSGDPEYDHPDCFKEGFDQDVLSQDMMRLSTIYPKETLCDECFVKMLHMRLSSPFLPHGEYTDTLVGQWSDIQEVCSTSLPLTTRSSMMHLGFGAPTPTTTTSAPDFTPTCAGTKILPTDSAMGCRKLAEKYKVATGDLIIRTGNFGCTFETELCAPLPCELEYLSPGGTYTCDTLRKEFSTEDTEISKEDFQAWNPFLVGGCETAEGYQFVCKTQPGGAYVQPPPIIAPTGTTYWSTAIPAAPTSSGTIKKCGKYHLVVLGDSCETVALRYGITLAQFLDFNSQVDEDCKNLWLDYSYCVGEVATPPPTKDGLCGPDNGHAICEGTEFGDCCSTSGYCGSGADYCGPGVCQSGKCTGPTPGETENGTCGPDFNDWVCGDSVFGKCCSIYGNCGNSADYCGPGNCYSGACDPDIGGPSIDGRCGPEFAGNKTCTDTQFGACCSIYGSCGDGSDWCAKENCYSGACQD